MNNPYTLKLYAAPLDTALPHCEISAAAHRMLDAILLQNYALTPADYTLKTGSMGKPQILTPLPKPNVCFNLAHTAGMAVLAVGGVPVGVDIEPSDRVISDAVRKRWLGDCPAEEAVTEWTKRESYGKLTGEGFIFALPKRPHTCRTWLFHGYTITLCVHNCDSDAIPDTIELFMNP